jgi:membrane associated rhomboid family serine protease
MKVEAFDAVTSDLNGSLAMSDSEDMDEDFEGGILFDSFVPVALIRLEKCQLSDNAGCSPPQLCTTTTTAVSSISDVDSRNPTGIAEANSERTDRDEVYRNGAVVVSAAAAGAACPQGSAFFSSHQENNDAAARPFSNKKEDHLARFLQQQQDEDYLFGRARQLRHYHYKARPYGILGLYHYLSDVQSDRAWARDVAAAAAARGQRQCQPFRPLPQRGACCGEDDSHGGGGGSLSHLSWSDYQELVVRKDGRGPALRLFSSAMVVSSAVLLFTGFGMNRWKVENMRVNPMVGPGVPTLLRLGALQRSGIVLDGEWYRILTAIPLHAGVLHWLVNTLALWWMNRWGLRFPPLSSSSWRPITVFVVAAIAGNVCSAAYSPFTISMGTSGGLFGWLGYCLAEVTANARLLLRLSSPIDEPYYTFPRWSVACWLALDLVVLIVMGLTPFVDNFAHMGGLLAGLGVGWSLQEPFAGSDRKFLDDDDADPTPSSSALLFCLGLKTRIRRYWTALVVASVIVLHAVHLARSDSNADVCRKCRYLSCVPFPFWTENKWWDCDSCERCPVVITTDHGSGTVWLDVTCPYGEVLNVPAPLDPTMSDEEILASVVPRVCRESCSL